MASGYVTSDGKDLDSRYLGIGAKAATAGRADSSAYADAAGRLNTTIAVRRSGNVVYASVYLSSYDSPKPYTFPCSGVTRIVMPTNFTANFTGEQTIESGLGYSNVHCFFVNKGDVITFRNPQTVRHVVFIATTPVST